MPSPDYWSWGYSTKPCSWLVVDMASTKGAWLPYRAPSILLLLTSPFLLLLLSFPPEQVLRTLFLLQLLPPINDRRKQILLKAEIGMAWKPKHWGSLAAPFLCQNFPMYNPFLFAAFRRFVSFCRGKLCILHSDSEQSSSLNCVPALRNSFLFFVSLIFYF